MRSYAVPTGDIKALDHYCGFVLSGAPTVGEVVADAVHVFAGPAYAPVAACRCGYGTTRDSFGVGGGV